MCIKDILQHKTWWEYSTIRLCFNTWGSSTSVGLLLLPSGGGGPLDFKWGGWLKDFFGFEFLILLGLFCGWKNLASIFGCLDLSRDILDIQTIPRFMMVPTYLRNLWGLEIRHGIFFEVYFWSRDFLGFWYLLPFDHPCSLKSKVPSLVLLSRVFCLIVIFFLCQDVSETDKEEAQAALEENVLKWVLCDIITINIYLWIISIELLRQSVSTFCLQSNLMFILICLSELCNYINLMKSKFVCSLFKMTD